MQDRCIEGEAIYGKDKEQNEDNCNDSEDFNEALDEDDDLNMDIVLKKYKEIIKKKNFFFFIEKKLK